MALVADRHNIAALEARLAALTALDFRCKNAIERGWLRHGIRTTKQQLTERKSRTPIVQVSAAE